MNSIAFAFPVIFRMSRAVERVARDCHGIHPAFEGRRDGLIVRSIMIFVERDSVEMSAKAGWSCKAMSWRNAPENRNCSGHLKKSLSGKPERFSLTYWRGSGVAARMIENEYTVEFMAVSANSDHELN